MSNLIPKTQEKKFELQFMYMINCPIICWVGFEDSVIKEQKEKYKLESMLHCIKTFETEIAPPYHMMLYLSHATQVAMPSRSFQNVYFYLFQNYFPKESTEFLNDDVLGKGDKITLDLNEIDTMNDLGNWIFKQQISAIKNKLKGLQK